MNRNTRWFAGALTAAALAVGGCSKGDPQGEARLKALSDKVTKLEAEVAKFKQVEEFVRPIMDQQKAQAAQEAASEPDPNARFAVSVAQNSFDGPAGAAVTIVEAFDFA